MHERDLLLLPELVQFISDWFQTRTLLRDLNTPHALLEHLVTESHELQTAFREHFNISGIKTPEILEEMADLVMFTLQLLNKIGEDAQAFVHGIWADVRDKKCETCPEDILTAASKLQEAGPNALEALGNFFSLVLGFSLTHQVPLLTVTKVKVDYMPTVIREEDFDGRYSQDEAFEKYKALKEMFKPRLYSNLSVFKNS